MTYIADLAAAQQTYAAAVKAHALAVKHTAPMGPEMAEMLRSRKPEAFAKMEAAVAEIAATIPALEAERARAATALEAIAQHACYRCQGTGNYMAPTSRFRGGKPYCFGCDGRGTRSPEFH